MDITKKKKRIIMFTIISFISIVLAYIIMISMYKSLEIVDAEGNYGLFLLYLFISYSFLALIGGSIALIVNNHLLITNILMDDDLTEEINKTCNRLRIINIMLIILVIVFFYVLYLFTKW